MLTDYQYVQWAARIVKLSTDGDHEKMMKEIDKFSKSIGNNHEVWAHLRDQLVGKRSAVYDLASIVVYYHVRKDMASKKK